MVIEIYDVILMAMGRIKRKIIVSYFRSSNKVEDSALI